MFWKFSHPYGLLLSAVVVIIVLAAGTTAWRFAFFFAPFAWTGEPARLARVLGLQPGMHIADIGAGSGALAVEMAAFVGSTGQVDATELDPGRRAAIERRVRRASLRNVHAFAAGVRDTGLPETCCDAVYMRTVFHHVADWSEFAADAAQSVRPGGRVAVIDFAPGTLWFHGADHGVPIDSVLTAFQATGFHLGERIDSWGGGMFLLMFVRDAAHESEP